MSRIIIENKLVPMIKMIIRVLSIDFCSGGLSGRHDGGLYDHCGPEIHSRVGAPTS